jgi:ribose/xylose/arabinose/galactoside ABC-type transport system permease subunit
MSGEKKRRPITLPVETGVAAVLIIASIWLARTFPGFRTGDNLSVILSSGAEVAIVAAGMTLVIATGGIDISVGSIVGLCGVVIGILAVNHGWNVWLACLAGMAVGGSCGLLNGLLVARFSLPPIIATLAMFSAARASAYLLSNATSISGLPQSLIDLGYKNRLGAPFAVWLAGAALLATGIILQRTSFGRAVKALGGNRQASFLSGIKIRRVELLVYAISGLMAGLSSTVVVARGATAVPDAGKFFELTAITAVVMGGTPVAGGRATIVGTALGVLTIGVITNGVRSYGKEDTWVQLALGLSLLLSVEVERWRIRRAARALVVA